MKKLRILQTDKENLVSNLRGEVGDIVFTWVLMRDLMAQASEARSEDPHRDLSNARLARLNVLVDKLSDEIVTSLAELGEEKVGRLNFYFAGVKLGLLQQEAVKFTKFVRANRFKEKRNYDISHKELPEKWSEHKHIHIPYPTLLRGLAMALRLVKKIDAVVLGPSASHLWREMRKRRYVPMCPPRAAYMLLPYLRLSEEDRAEVIQQEMAEGKEVWVDMETVVDGVQMTVKACKEWGALLLGRRMVMLQEYPLIDLKSIETHPMKADCKGQQ